MTETKRLAAGAVVALVMALLIPATALPCGPGVHIRESDNIWQMLVDEYDNLETLQDEPYFETYLHIGAILPDFQWFLPIKQGHSPDFSLYLIAQSVDMEPRFQIAALGHLMHNSVSDPLCEQFWTPTLMASAPLGMVYLLEGYGDAHGMSEGITEVLGDLLVGDWDALIDLIYDMYLEDDDAFARGHEGIVWYVEQMNAYYGTDTDAEAVWQSLVDKISEYEMYLMGFDRQGAKDFFHELKGDTPADTIAFFTGDLIADLAGDAAARCEEYDTNIVTVMQSDLVEQSFWDIYENTLLADLSAFWYLDRAGPFAGTMTAEDVANGVLGWPTWGRNPMISGNVMSTMQFHPEVYDVIPGLIVDDIVWMDGNGNQISEYPPAVLTDKLKVRVRYYTALDFAGDIRLVVRNDMPGLNQSGDEIVGEHTETVTLDPRGYVLGERSVIEAEFEPGAALVDGFYLEMYADDGDQPWFTSNWDTIMAGGRVPVNQKIYRDNFATYGKWPPSLPVSLDLRPADCEVFVTARTFAGGGPIPGTTVSLVPETVQDPSIEPRTLDTSANGMAVFDIVQPGTYSIVAATPAGFVNPVLDPTMVECNPAVAGQVWTNQEFHVIPRVWVNNGISGRNDCIVFETNAPEFWGKAEKFIVSVTNAMAPEVVLLPATEKAARPKIEACFPSSVENGTSVVIHIVPKYVNGLGLGVEGVSTPVLIDSTAPVIDTIEIFKVQTTCDDVWPVHPFHARLFVTSQVGAITSVAWSKGDDLWEDRDFESVPGEMPYTSMITVVFLQEDMDDLSIGDDIAFKVTNSAGISGELSVKITEAFRCSDVIIEPGTDLTVADVVTDNGGRTDTGTLDASTGWDVPLLADDMVFPDEDVNEDDGGCSAGTDGNAAAGLVLLCLVTLALLVYRRRGHFSGLDA